MNAKTFGEMLRKYRVSQGLTLQDIGLMVEPPADKSTVSKWESGKYLPNLGRLSMLAEILKIDVNEVDEGKGAEKTLAAILAEQRLTNELLLEILLAVKGSE